jgi:hypothetical protein
MVFQAGEAAKSKVLILDGNPDVTSKGALFRKAWAEEFKGIVEYRPNYVLTDVDIATRTAKFDVQDPVRADVLNVVPPQRAGVIARVAGVVTANNRWCEVDFLSLIGAGEEHPRPGRCDPGGVRDAQIRPHGESTGQGLRGSDRRAPRGPGAEPGAGAQQCLL